ncbi:hypothetical protein DL766_002867 [Monosporascus sp. MC13-8B]|uniref:FAD-binding PCMH-type domain-containing protein n=1 Tax=Monosporascus cannonballus TaxID=155416 RepID=A0ABY0HEF5_9PEZI|nr:hypothetical protein DL762_002547 [Monosporascus cannonballus]RYO95192.1 hypothetical protein DL763_003760 [Monosporascus cannonballus]RYP34676.1 hypothetical protein DL766_002867 [Monosporascus sp. MC13-8B]
MAVFLHGLTNEREISAALRFLSRHDIPYFAQGGAHGYSPTLAVIQHAVMIKMERFDEIRFNDDNSVTVGGAVLFGDLMSALYAAGRELTVGSCVCVGSTGAMLGGGHGRLQGKHGLTSDALRSVRMVLWNGTVVEASESKNPDLFWGMRGAGHNFGVVIESTYETFPQENDGMHYNADMVFTSDSLEGVINVINSLIPDQDPALALDLLFFIDPSTMSPVIFLNLVYAGTQAEGQRYADLFASTNPGNSTTGPRISRLSVDASVATFGDLNNVAAGGAITAACATGSRQNAYTSTLRTLDVSTMRQLFASFATFVQENPLAINSLILFEIFGQEGIDAKPNDYSAYPNRGFANVLTLLQMTYTNDAVADAADTWARQWRDTLTLPDVSGYPQQHVYENYAHGDEPLEAIYGYDEWRRERLTSLKRKFDPKDNFNGYHAIPLDGMW